MNALDERLTLQLEFLKLYTQVRKRPWGLLLYNLENPDYHEANGARYIRCTEETATSAIDEIVRFYQTRRLTPRVIIDPQATPVDLRRRLEAKGFESSASSYRVMRWQGEPPPPPSLPAGVDADTGHIGRHRGHRADRGRRFSVERHRLAAPSHAHIDGFAGGAFLYCLGRRCPGGDGYVLLDGRTRLH